MRGGEWQMNRRRHKELGTVGDRVSGDRTCWVHSLVGMPSGAQWNTMEQQQGRERERERKTGEILSVG